MSQSILKKRSKINLLNAQVAQLNDSGLFSAEEISNLTSPLVAQVQDLQKEIFELEESNNTKTEKLNTPLTVS